MPAPTPPRLPASPLAAGATIPLTFIGAGLVAAAAGTVWLACFPGLLALPHLHPYVIAFAHLWLLGALLTICFGAVYQLLPVLANTAFTGRGLAWTHCALHLAGTALMIHAFLSGQMGWVALSGSAVSIGVGLFAVNVARTLRAAPRIDPILAAFGCATGWLVAAVLAGLTLALNLRFGGWSLDALAFLRMHAHLGVAGFFVTLLQGAMFRLVPMFALTEVRDLSRIRVALALSQTGLLVLAPALAWHWHVAGIVGAGLLLAAFALSAFELRLILRTRRKRRFEPGLRGFLLGLSLLVGAAVGGTVLAVVDGGLPAALAYGVLAVLGGVLGSVEGMLCKIIPFLVWMRVYGPRVGRQPTPAAAALGRARFERLWIWSHASALALLTAGTLGENEYLLAAGAGLFALGHVALFTSLATVARHLWRPVTSKPATSFPAQGIA